MKVMQRKEIFFKKLSFIIGVILIISFVTGTEFPFLLRSEIKLYQEGGCFGEIENEMILKQDTNKIYIVYFYGPYFSPNKGIKDGEIPKLEFKLFWDSLNSLGFWGLKSGYAGRLETTDDIGGVISVSFETKKSVKMTKTIQFSTPENCPFEFKRVYQLIGSMDDYARNQPTLNNLLKYGEMKNSWYANANIGRIKDSKYLDTLMTLLFTEKKYVDGIIRALGNIGDEKAIPLLYQIIEILDSTTLELPAQTRGAGLLNRYLLSREQLILTTFKSIISIKKERSVQILKKYLSSKYSPMIRTEASMLLTRFHDYSGIPVLIDCIKEQKVSFDEFNIFMEFCYKDKRVIDALIKDLGLEVKKKEPNDKIIVELIRGLSKITTQNYPYNPSDSLAAKRETINKWINWWKENKDKFK